MNALRRFVLLTGRYAAVFSAFYKPKNHAFNH